MYKKLLVGNWKMNLELNEAKDLLTTLVKESQHLGDNNKGMVVCVPYIYTFLANQIITHTPHFYHGVQNVAEYKNGAYTGEISASMIKAMNVKYAIIGHSERREYFNENSTILKTKIARLLENNIEPIFCCGEPLAIRENNQHNAYVEKQIQEALFHLTPNEMQTITIAYEPIWAIGTGKTASPQQAQDIHAHIRQLLTKQYGKNIADNIKLLYGGSVKASNAKELFQQPDINGALVGGASLIAKDFIEIFNAL